MKFIIAQFNPMLVPPMTLAGSVPGLMNRDGIDSDDAGGSFINSRLPGARRYSWPVMKNILLSIGAASFIAAWGAANLQAAETNATTARIGIYDSRAVAYAWFWSGKHQKQLNELMQNARAAKSAGDTNRFKELNAMLGRQQDEMHREVFSTALPTEALAELKESLPKIQKAASVSALVSRWDAAALKTYPDAAKVDVTDQLVHEFNPAEKQLKTIPELEKSAPLPLDECNQLIRKGEI